MIFIISLERSKNSFIILTFFRYAICADFFFLSLCEAAEKEVADSESVLKNLSATFDELVSWAELYEKTEFAQKKMIVNCLIRRVDVCRDYKLKIDFNFDFQQFINGINCIIKKHLLQRK